MDLGKPLLVKGYLGRKRRSGEAEHAEHVRRKTESVRHDLLGVKRKLYTSAT